MAGTIIADTLTHSTAGSIATNYVVEGSAKAWVNFNGTGTVAVRDNFNVSSVTDGATGRYQATFTSSMADINFSASGTAGSSTNSGVDNGAVTLRIRAATYLDTFTRNVQSSGTTTDYDTVNYVVHGDLA